VNQPASNLGELIADIRERVLYLQELGVTDLNVQLAEMPIAHPDESRTQIASYTPQASRPILPSATTGNASEAERPAGSRLASLPSLVERPTSVQRKIAAQRQTGSPQLLDPNTRSQASRVTENLPSLREPVETLDQIIADIGNCVRCPLHAGRTQIVHSTGHRQARLMFVGEAPGADEDAQGLPFVGRAGKLLTDIIEAIGYTRESVFIGNINRCRPPGNRAPVPLETATCKPFLLREIAVVRPKVIVVLGNTAMHNLLDIKTPISKLRGQFQDYFGVKVMPTFHPAYLLRDPHKKREVWEDMKMVRDYLQS
jgi:DNA polymerase